MGAGEKQQKAMPFVSGALEERWREQDVQASVERNVNLKTVIYWSRFPCQIDGTALCVSQVRAVLPDAGRLSASNAAPAACIDILRHRHGN